MVAHRGHRNRKPGRFLCLLSFPSCLPLGLIFLFLSALLSLSFLVLERTQGQSSDDWGAKEGRKVEARRKGAFWLCSGVRQFWAPMGASRGPSGKT